MTQSIRERAYDLFQPLVGDVDGGGGGKGGLPVKDLPKTSSSGGTRVLGAVVLVMDSFEGSMSCAFTAEAARAAMLYSLGPAMHAGRCSCKEAEAAVDERREKLWRSIVRPASPIDNILRSLR